MMDTTRNGNGTLAILVVVLFVGVALAGCVGGGSSAGADDGNDTSQIDPDDPDAPTTTGPGEAGSGEAKHVHNRWFDNDQQLPPGSEVDELTLAASTTYTINSFVTDTSDPRFPLDNCPNAGTEVCAGKVIVTPDETEDGTRVVPPGTERITVTLDYNKGSYRNLKIWYQDPNARDDAVWMPLSGQEGAEPGETMTIPAEGSPKNISVDPDTDLSPDDGHASSSAWRWLIEVRGNPAPGPATTPSMTGPDGLDVDVTITAHRQDAPLPLEPPHPTFYEEDPMAETSVYQIARVSGTTNGQFVHAGPLMAEMDGCHYEPQEGAPCLPARSGSGLTWYTVPGFEGTRNLDPQEWTDIKGERLAKALVPPQTEQLVTAIQFDGGQTQGEIEVCLRARTSPSQPSNGVELDCAAYAGEDELVFQIPVQDGETDSFYASNWGGNNSRWQFVLQIRAPQQAQADVFPVHSPGTFSGSFDAAILATSQTNMSAPPGWVFN